MITSEAASMADIELSISTDKICFIAAKAREFEVKDLVTVPDDASNGTDDGMVAVLEDHSDDPVLHELRSFIGSLSQDEQIDLVTLAWLGRGDAELDGWDDLHEQAAQAHNRRTASYLLGMPLLPDYLQEGLAALGLSCQDFEEAFETDGP
jgi:hypothetical protein